MAKPRNIASCLNTSTDRLQKTLERASQLDRLNRSLKALLPSALAEQCNIANIRGATLIIQVSNNAWATRLRYHTPQLLKALHQQLNLKQVREIHINICPVPAQRPRPSRQFRLSAQSAAVITDTAQVTKDPELRAALLRLAKHASKKIS